MEAEQVDSLNGPADAAISRVQLLGPMMIMRNGAAVVLPASRKVRALFAYLALVPRATTRSQFCELLWDIPNDPRGELRWCLSKIRSFLDTPERKRVNTGTDTVAPDLADCAIDALQVLHETNERIEALPTERLRALVTRFAGNFLEGLAIDRNPDFNAWLTSQ